MISTAALLVDGWTLTQSEIWTTAPFLKALERRGFRLRDEDIESLCRQEILVPLIAIHDQRQTKTLAVSPGPSYLGSRVMLGINEAATEG